MVQVVELKKNFSKRDSCFLLLFYLQLIFFAACKNYETENSQPNFHYFKLNGLNRLVLPATLGPGTAYVHHALSKDEELAPPHECGLGSLADAARAVLVYLRYVEITGDSSVKAPAQKLLATILRLQKPDGLFFNTLDAQGQPAICSTADETGFGDTEVRAMWALAAGTEFFTNRDRSFAANLHETFWRSFVHVDSCLNDYGSFSERDGLQLPQWLPYRSGADAASELILAFEAMSQSSLNNAEQMRRLKQATRKFAVGILRMQVGDAEQFPYGAHLAHESYWHGWGNCAMQALALAGIRLNETEMIESAITEAENFVPYLQKIKFAHRFNILEVRENSNRIDYFPQKAADIRPLVTGLIELARITDNKRYARRAGKIARWFRGENLAHETIYVAKTGLAKDYIQSRNYVTPTLTAEATVEALMAILEVEANPDSRREFYAPMENVFDGKP
jgi:hypothetical protein